MAALTRESAAEILTLELERLDDMQSAVYSEAASGDVSKINCILNISHRRAQLLGLYPDSGKSVKATATLTPLANGADKDGKVSIEVSFVHPKANGHDLEEA